MQVPRCVAAIVACSFLLVPGSFAEEGDKLSQDSIAPVVQHLLRLDMRDEAMRQIIEKQQYRNVGYHVGDYKETTAAPVQHVVVCPQPSGPPLFAVFLQTPHNSEPHRPQGHVILVDSRGAIVRLLNAANSVGHDEIIADINGDGIVEAVMSHGVNGAEILFVLPLTPEQSPILRILFESKRMREKKGDFSSRWRWTVENAGRECVVRLGLENQRTGEFTESAAYRWSAGEQAFVGPEGRIEKGFMRIKDSAMTAAERNEDLGIILRFVRGKD